MHRWWYRCLANAGVVEHGVTADSPMHESRHTAITEFLRSQGNLKLAQQLARHASIQTTADVYGHLDDVDLERALGEMKPLLGCGQPFPPPATIPPASRGKWLR
jgi:integrase